MTEYIQVPVPAGLVTEVMQLIIERSSTAKPGSMDPSHAVTQGQLDDGDTGRNWTRAQLETLHASNAPSVKVFCEVLSILANISPNPMPIDEIGQRLGGVKGLTLRQQFGPVTRWMRKRMGGDIRWPFTSPDPVAHPDAWAMNDHNAVLWKQVTSHT